jgi:Na+/proline symporter
LHLQLLDSVVILVSLVLVVSAVLRAAGKKQSGSEYFLAGRDLAWPFVGMSLFASNISAEHVVGMAGDGYRIGMVTGGFEWMAAWCLIITCHAIHAALPAQQDLHHPGIPRAPLRLEFEGFSLGKSSGTECLHQECH